MDLFLESSNIHTANLITGNTPLQAKAPKTRTSYFFLMQLFLEIAAQKNTFWCDRLNHESTLTAFLHSRATHCSEGINAVIFFKVKKFSAFSCLLHGSHTETNSGAEDFHAECFHSEWECIKATWCFGLLFPTAPEMHLENSKLIVCTVLAVLFATDCTELSSARASLPCLLLKDSSPDFQESDPGFWSDGPTSHGTLFARVLSALTSRLVNCRRTTEQCTAVLEQRQPVIIQARLSPLFLNSREAVIMHLSQVYQDMGQC